jgi:hypothetical protein
MWCYVRYHTTTTTTTNTNTNITYMKGIRFASEEMKVVFDYKTKLGLIVNHYQSYQSLLTCSHYN